jgi:hypothetical protein
MVLWAFQSGKAKEFNPTSLLFEGAGESHMEEFGPHGARYLYIEIKAEWTPGVASLA